MIKKIAVFSALAIVLAIGAFGLVGTSHAQEAEIEQAVVEQAEVEQAPAAQVMTQEEAAYEYQYTYQYGDQNGEAVATMTQSRVRTQTRDPQEGNCDGEPIQRQLRQNLHVAQNEMRQQRQNLCDGTCNGLGQGN